MKILQWIKIPRLPDFAATVLPDPQETSRRIRFMERSIGLPVKILLVGVLFYYLFFSGWFDEVASFREATLFTVRLFFLIYVVITTAAAIMLVGMNQLPLRMIQTAVFVSAFIDGLFLAALTLITGGFESLLFWAFLGLIVRNAVSLPEAPTQIVLNLLISIFYLVAGLMEVAVSEVDAEIPEGSAEPYVLRLALLWLMTICCYGVQVLFDKQRQAEDEAREFALRREQLRITGRLAGEIAHQLKNPLGIINNAAFNLQRNVKEGRSTITQQIQIIREEVSRSDQIITDLMGYAKLAEGKLERIDVKEELDRILLQAFPPGQFEVQIQRDYADLLPPLLMQRHHLSEIVLNILQNAREAMEGKGRIHVGVRYGENYSVVVTIHDSGPGIPPDMREKVFEPYFTTKPKGTGLGLAIVKHNVEIYGGTVQLDSELGNGTRFILELPAKSLMKVRK